MSEWIPLDNHPWNEKPQKWADVLTTDGDLLFVCSLGEYELWTGLEGIIPEWQPTHWMPLPEPPKC